MLEAAARQPSRAAAILIFDLASGIRVAAMEKLAGVDTVIFDKTGTLTMGTPVVTEITTFNGLTAPSSSPTNLGPRHRR